MKAAVAIAASMLMVSSVCGDILFTKVNPTNGHTYHIISPQTWIDAQIESNSLGGHLVAINNQIENTWIIDNLLGLDGIPNNDRLWIGLSDSSLIASTEGTFVWTSGEEVTFTDWDDGQPSGMDTVGGEDFVEIRATGWNDLTNDGPGVLLAGIAEIVPEPTTLTLLALSVVGVTMRRRKTALRSPDARHY